MYNIQLQTTYTLTHLKQKTTIIIGRSSQLRVVSKCCCLLWCSKHVGLPQRPALCRKALIKNKTKSKRKERSMSVFMNRLSLYKPFQATRTNVETKHGWGFRTKRAISAIIYAYTRSWSYENVEHIHTSQDVACIRVGIYNHSPLFRGLRPV